MGEPALKNLAFTCLFLLLGMMLVAASFKICAFNIQSFGQAKAANQRVMRALVQILSRCDISAVQEVRDSKGLAIQALLQKLNSQQAAEVACSTAL
uniref:Uncharacterized protein n=1 Tax=Pseudonaja textilis TaxID=8673 RepID=A0A670YB56_PSETE